jgi:hypothetical protein
MMETDNTDERVWSYLLRNRQTATAEDVALNCDVTVEEAQRYIDRIGSPDWRNVSTREHPAFVKNDSDKPRMDLLPPEMLIGVSNVLTYGAKKYSANNWANGADWGRYYGAMMRHMVAWWSGEDVDDETGFSHLHHAGCCLAFLMAYENRGLGTDDRPKGASNAGMDGQKSSSSEAA